MGDGSAEDFDGAEKLQEFRASLPQAWMQEHLDMLVRVKGAEYVHSILGTLKNDPEEIATL